jgi:hypothetical protein
MEIHDSFNNQFKLYNYISYLNTNLLQYLENNNIDINYYCFFSKVVDKKHHIITSQTTKRKNNGYRLITIQDMEADNNILEYGGYTNIIFDGIHVKITPIIEDIFDVTEKLKIKIIQFNAKSLDNQTVDCRYNYDMNILENTVINIVYAKDVGILYKFENTPSCILQALTFNDSHYHIINKNVLPSSLKTLTFGGMYNLAISENVLPNALQTLTFGHWYNQIINENVLPISLQTLTFGRHYNQIINTNVLPNALQTLTFGDYYDQIINENVLPNALQTLTFGYCYGQIIGINVLPNSLQTLSLYNNYIHKINDNVLPSSLQVIFCRLSYLNQRKKHFIIPESFHHIVKDVC